MSIRAGGARLTGAFACPMYRPVPQWRNGRRGRLKICCLKGRAGSSPAWGTIPSNLDSKIRGRCGSLLLHLSDLQLYLLPGSPAHATPYKGGVAFKIAPNPGLNLSAVEPDVLQFEV